MTTNGKLRAAGLLCLALAILLYFYTDARNRFLADSMPLGTYSILRATLPHNAAEWKGLMLSLTWVYAPFLFSSSIGWKSKWAARASLLIAVFVMSRAGVEAWHAALHTVGSDDDQDSGCGPSLDLADVALVVAWLTGALLSLGGLIAWLARKCRGARVVTPHDDLLPIAEGNVRQ